MNSGQPLNSQIIAFLEQLDRLQSINNLIPEASIRQYYRISYQNGRSAILCYDPQLCQQNDFIQLQKFFSDNWIPVPEIYKIEPEKGLVLQQDCGQQDLCTLSEKDYLSYLKQSLTWIIKIQSLTPPQLVRQRSFDKEKLLSEVNHTYRGHQLASRKLSLQHSFSLEFRNFLEQSINFLAEFQPKVLCHRDYHSRNLILGTDKTLYMIDFQDARMGTPMYDLVSILYDAYRPLSFQQREDTYQYFLTLMPYQPARIRECYIMQALQRCFKALGTYLVMVFERKLEKYRANILPCLQNLLEICQIGHLTDELYMSFQELTDELKIKL